MIAGDAAHAGPARRLENMSAPPRSTINVRPLRAPEAADAVPATATATATAGAAPRDSRAPGASGMRLVCRVALDALIRQWIPRAIARARTAATAATGLDPKLGEDRRRLLAVVVLARNAVALQAAGRAGDAGAPGPAGGTPEARRRPVPDDPRREDDPAPARRKPRPAFAAVRAAAGRPQETLEDELVALIRQLDSDRLRLPAFGFFRDVPLEPGEAAAETESDLARALFIASHRYGELFLRDADPVPPPCWQPQDLVSAANGGAR